MKRKKIAKLLMDIEAVSVSPKDPFVYTSGRKGPIYCDNRLILSYPKTRTEIVSAFLEEISEKNLEFDVVAGVATGAIATAALIAEALDKPMVYIRSKSKGHGKENQIEGKLKPNSKVLVIEDLINTGGSSIRACEAVMDVDCEVVSCLAIFTYSHSEAHKKFSDKEIPLYTLSDFNALLELITDEEDKEILREWHKDPKNWNP